MNRPIDKRQPNAAPALAGREIEIEDVVEMLRWYADPGVLEYDLDPPMRGR